jgi:hypothetical protein
MLFRIRTSLLLCPFAALAAAGPCEPPSIPLAGQPVSAAACNLVATFTVAATGSSAAYRWQYSLGRSNDGGLWNDWEDILVQDLDKPIANASGGDTNILRVRALAGPEPLAYFSRGIIRFRCVVTNPCGTVTSEPANFSVCHADFTCDGMVDDSDFVRFATAYEILECASPIMPGGCSADMSADGSVDDADFVIFAAAYNELLCP